MRNSDERNIKPHAKGCRRCAAVLAGAAFMSVLGACSTRGMRMPAGEATGSTQPAYSPYSAAPSPRSPSPSPSSSSSPLRPPSHSPSHLPSYSPSLPTLSPEAGGTGAEGLSTAEINSIKQIYINEMQSKDSAYRNAGLGDIIVGSYCGTYNGAIVVLIDDLITDKTGTPWVQTVEGVKIHYSGGRALSVVKDGRLYGLQEAFDGKIITKDDLDMIAAEKNRDYYDYE